MIDDRLDTECLSSNESAIASSRPRADSGDSSVMPGVEASTTSAGDPRTRSDFVETHTRSTEYQRAT